FLSLAAQPQTGYHTHLFGHLNPEPPAGSNWTYSALTGYAAPNGREYALLGGFLGTHIIDITTSPVKEVALIPGPHSGWRELKTVGKYAYVVSEGGAGLQIIDLTNLPASATLVNSDTSVFRSGHTITKDNIGFIYVNGS